MLTGYERAFTRVCFDAEPSEEDLRELGSMRQRWMLYREMVRSRLHRMLKQGLPKTTELLGSEAYDRWFCRWLAEHPPRSRYVRDIVPSFCAMLEGADDASLPAALPDLVRYERARWELANVPVELPAAEEFVFEKRPVLNPAVRLLRLSHAVHEDGAPAPTRLLVYRRPDNHKVGYRILTPLFADLVEAWLDDAGTVTDTVKAAAAANDRAIDEKLVNQLGATLADWLERGILLGAR